MAMNLNSGGAERQMVTVGILLKKRGYDVSVVCYEGGTFFLEQLERAGIEVTWLLKNGAVSRLLAFRRIIKKGQYDVVISFLETPNILNCFSAIGRHSWRVITGERSAKKELLSSIRGHVVAWLQKKSDCLVCNSHKAADVWCGIYPFMKKRIRTIYNLVNVSQEHLTSTTKKDCSYTRIVVAASYQYLKNPTNVVQAIALLSEENRKKIRLDWYGNPDVVHSAFSEVKSIITEKQLQNIIGLHDATKQIHQEMLDSDFVGLFSSVEGLPNAICEAMMLGKPIIMSQVSDYSFLVNGNGFLCDGNSPESIMSIFTLILSISSEDKKRMGEQSKNIASQLFNQDSIIRQWESIINGGAE